MTPAHASARAVRASVVWTVLALGAAPDAGAQEPAPRVPVDAHHPACREVRWAWVAGGEAPAGLPTFGLLTAGPRGEGSAVGLGERSLNGPIRAGATVDDAPSGEAPAYRYPGPRRLDRHRPLGHVRLVRGGAWWAGAELSADADEVRAALAGLGTTLGPVRLWGGSLTLRASPTCESGLVLGGEGGPAWGLEAVLVDGVHLPWLGRVRVGVQVGALPEAGPGNEWPLLHTMRLEIRPGDDWVVGLSRAAIFGGSTTTVPVTPRTVGLMLLGFADAPGKDSDFDNQVAALDVQWRTALGGRPAVLTGEWATDDPGATLQVPGVRLSAEVAWSLVPAGWSGLEVVHVARSTKTFPPWYRHGALAWGWTDQGVPLGHWLAGDGTSVILSQRTGSLALSAGFVHRGPENLLSPDQEGSGIRAAGEVRHRAGPWESRLRGAVERANATAWTLDALFLYRF